MYIMDDYLDIFANFLTDNFNDEELDNTEFICKKLANIRHDNILYPKFCSIFKNVKPTTNTIHWVWHEFILYFYKQIDIEIKLKDLLTKDDLGYCMEMIGCVISGLNSAEYLNDFNITKENLAGLKNVTFNYCHFEKIDVPENIEGIRFNSCYNLVDANLHGGLKYISFNDCYKLEEITIPEGVVKLDNCWIYNNPKLKTISLPKSLKYLEDGAFYKCNNLTDIYYAGTKKEWTSILNNNSYWSGAITPVVVHCIDGDVKWEIPFGY